MSIHQVDEKMDVAMNVAIEAAKAGGKVLLEYFREGAYSTRAKRDTSLQTTADVSSEREILQIIQRAFPKHSINSEERGLLPSTSSEFQWLVDPLDGTENFVLGIPYFSSSIALCRNNKPEIAVVYNPFTEELYSAIKGEGAKLNGNPLRPARDVTLRGCRAFFIPDFDTKRQKRTAHFRDELYMQCRRLLDTWSPALDWCLVASGKVDLVVALENTSIRPDAGTLILEEAGGIVTDFGGNPFTNQNSGRIVGCSSEVLHRQFLQFSKEVYFNDGN